jgi:hypothetical protein
MRLKMKWAYRPIGFMGYSLVPITAIDRVIDRPLVAQRVNRATEGDSWA